MHAYWDTPSYFHRLRSCNPLSKGSLMSDNKKPAARINLHPISAAIWRNENPKGTFYSTTFERSFKDDQGQWQRSDVFGSGDLLLLAKVADLAHSEIIKLRSADRSSEQPADAT